MTTAESEIIVARDGNVARVTMNRPERRNSLSDAMLTALAEAFTTLRDDREIRVVVVTGAAPVFSAGADAPLRASMSPEERRRVFGSRRSQFRRLFERAKPFRALAEVKARIEAIARTGTPAVNAMTEGFLER
jgi:enoyl-CoA hydratase/carnithine racemase